MAAIAGATAAARALPSGVRPTCLVRSPASLTVLASPFILRPSTHLARISGRQSPMVAAAKRRQRENPFAAPVPTEAEDPPPDDNPSAAEADPVVVVEAGRKGRFKAMNKRQYARERGVPLKREGAKLKKLEDLKVGDRIGGRVRITMDYGVIVNVRCEQDALLHVTQIPKTSDFAAMRRGSKLHELAVIEVDPQKSVLKVSMRPQGQEPGGYLEKRKIRTKDLAEGDFFEARAKKFLQSTNKDGWSQDGGVFVDFGCQLDGFVESSEGIPTWTNAKFEVQVAKGGLADEHVKVRKRVLLEVLDEDGNVVRPTATAAPSAAKGEAAAAATAVGAVAGAAVEAAGAEEPEEEWEGDEGEWDDEDDKWSEFDDF